MRFEALQLDEAGFRVIVDELRFRFHKWDAYLSGRLRILPEALVLDAAEHAETVALCRRLAAALARVTAGLEQCAEVHERLAIPAAVRTLIAAEAPSPLQLARYDLVPTREGWMLPEFNEDAPGGFNECLAASALFAAALPCGGIAGDFAGRLLAGLPPGRRVGLVFATGYAEDLQHMLVLADLLRSHGREPVLASPEHLSCARFGRPRLQGVAVDWILRFFPGEWYPHLSDLRAWQRTVARIPVINPLGRLLRQSKGLYAWWREAAAIDEADRELLNGHTPHSQFLDAELLPRLLAEQEEWVLKRMFGRMGDAVILGRRTPAGDWQQALAAALRQPGAWIAQQAFVPLPVLTSRQALQYPVLGLYLVNGEFAGHYSRSDETGFTTHEANYVVTAVEAA